MCSVKVESDAENAYKCKCGVWLRVVSIESRKFVVLRSVAYRITLMGVVLRPKVYRADNGPWADQQGCPISTPRKRCQSSKINSAVAKKSVPTRLWREIIVEQ